MNLLIIIGIAALAALLLRPAPRSHVVYVPIEVAEERGGLGCTPLIVVAALALVVIALLSGALS